METLKNYWRFTMTTNKKAKLSAYLSAPLSIVIGFILAILFFTFILKETSPVPIFIIFAIIEAGSMALYGILPDKGKNIARMTSMFLIGSMLLLAAGILSSSNYQLEGFFFYLLSGTMSGVLIHFAMAKIIGPIFFSRNWCSWGCWSSMVFDLLPFKKNVKWNSPRSGKLRYLHFFISLTLVAVLFYVFKYAFVQTDPAALKNSMGTRTELIWFLLGNLFYYVAGITLAFKYKDNRAFCKYLCPLTVTLKFTDKFTLLRIKGDQNSCNNCGTCSANCPMGIDIPAYVKAGTRVKSTECIMCMRCVANCPEAALRTSIGLDFAGQEFLK